MKLIRLTTSDENAQFDSLFNEDIIINENSQICLQSLSIEDEYKEMEINSSNDNLYYNLRFGEDTSINRKITLNHTGNSEGQQETYNSNNFQVLLDDMIVKLNQGLQVDFAGGNTFTKNNIEIGTQFKVSVSKDTESTGKILIQAKQSKMSSRYSDFVANIPSKLLVSTGAVGSVVSHTTTTETAIWNKPNLEPKTSNNKYMTYFQHSLTKGAGVWRIKLLNMYDDATEANLESGAILGVTTTVPASYIDTRDMADSEISYGIHIDKVGGTYKVIKNGVWTDSGVNVVYGTTAGKKPIMEIIIELGRIRGKLYQDNGTGGNIITRWLFDDAYDGDTTYYPFMVFRGAYTTTGNKGTRFTQLRLTSDPYYDLTTNYPDNSNLDNAIVGTTAPQQSTIGKAFFQFEGASLAEFLGFKHLRYPQTDTILTSNFSIKGETVFKFSDLSDTFLVLLDNIKLKSYDDYDVDGNRKGSRRDLLAVVNKTQPSGNITFQANNLLWLDIDNFQKMYIQNMKVRVLKADYSPIVANGLTSMVILIRDRRE